MEVELKFLIEDKLAQERLILKDRHLAKIKDEGSEEEIELKATYLDTEDMDLCKRKMAFRVRLENGSPIATLKWGGEATDGLHVRGELNVPVDESYMRHPKTDIFRGSEMYRRYRSCRRGQASETDNEYRLPEKAGFRRYRQEHKRGVFRYRNHSYRHGNGADNRTRDRAVFGRRGRYDISGKRTGVQI